ncbi:MAG: response regulator [Acidimicrobiia bacterium]
MSSPVLIIEDDDDIRELLISRIRRLGYRPVAVSSAEAGLELAAAEVPELVVLDIRLPGIDGWEFLRRLRASPSTVGVPVMVVSIVDIDESADHLPVDGYIVKPFRATRIDQLARQLLGEAGRPTRESKP